MKAGLVRENQHFVKYQGKMRRYKGNKIAGRNRVLRPPKMMANKIHKCYYLLKFDNFNSQMG